VLLFYGMSSVVDLGPEGRVKMVASLLDVMEQGDLTVLKSCVVGFLVEAEAGGGLGGTGRDAHLMRAGLVVGGVRVEAEATTHVAEAAGFEATFGAAAGEEDLAEGDAELFEDGDGFEARAFAEGVVDVEDGAHIVAVAEEAEAVVEE
jgi:hypothetical protein